MTTDGPGDGDADGNGHGQDYPAPGEPARDPEETPAQRLTRNWGELLQELRVAQTGIQVLTGFLLTVPFNSRFDQLTHLQRTAYLVVLSGAILSTALMMSPAAFHRVLFRHGERKWLVGAANWAARAGLVALALTTSGVVWLVFDLVTDRTLASIAGAVALLFFAIVWVVIPLRAPRVPDPIG